MDNRQKLINKYAINLYNEQEECCAQGGVAFDKEAAMKYAIEEATIFVDKCIAVGAKSND